MIEQNELLNRKIAVLSQLDDTEHVRQVDCGTAKHADLVIDLHRSKLNLGSSAEKDYYFTHENNVLDTLLRIVFNQNIPQMEIAMVQHVESAAWLVRHIALATDLSDMFDKVVEIWQEALVILPRLQDLSEC